MAGLKSRLRAARDQNVRLFNETQEALERQTATADILKVIASSPSDVQPVFDAIAESAKRLFGSHTAVVTRVIDGVVHFAAGMAENEATTHAVKGLLPYPLSSPRIHARVARTGELAINTDSETADVPQSVKELARAMGWRSFLVVPMLRNGTVIGTIGITRREPGSFEDKAIDLLKTFADQAVIAIENVRLFNDTREALERQTATADILKVIASSPSDVQPVFAAIAERSNRLIEGLSTAVYSIVDDAMHLMAFTRTNPEADAALRASFPRPLAEATWGEQVRNGEIVQIPDFAATVESEQPKLREMARLRGFRSVLFVPLLRDGTTIGIIGVTRAEAGTFAAHHVQLLQTFADQAVIAIGNVRLFDEVQAKTRDLTEALTYQTGSANILSVIASSPTDVEPVLKAIVESACELCEAYDAVVLLKDGNDLRYSAHHGPIPIGLEKSPINRNWVTGRAVVDKVPMHVHDLLSAEGDQFPQTRETLAQQGHRTVLSVPLLREGQSIGAITLRRFEVNPFSDKQIGMLQTFADQAVIAIGNVRLFDEVQAKTRDLTESLEQQTATSEVLEVISSSPGELQPVFQKMLENATRVCEANFGIMNLWDGEQFHSVADHNIPPAFAAYREQTALRPHPDSSLAAVVRTHQAAQVHDIRESPGYLAGVPMVVRIVDVAGARTLMVVPMLKEGELVGAITIFRQEVRPFTDKQIALVENFTKQAVIAIENTRLLKELRESLQQQTATADVLKVISRSAFDLQAVLDTLTESAARLCEADEGIILQPKGDGYGLAANWGLTPDKKEFIQSRTFRPGGGTLTGRVLTGGNVIHIRDVLEEPGFNSEGDPTPARTRLGVPLLRDGNPIGVFVLTRQAVQPFTEKQIELVSTFSDQAVIAVENARLFEEVQARTRDLTESLQQQTATADVLKVISGSPGKIEPVFDKILASARQLCDAKFGHLLRFDGETWQAEALHNVPEAHARFWHANPVVAGPETNLGRVQRSGKPDQVADVRLASGYLARSPLAVATVELAGARTLLTVPLLKEGKVIGGIALYRTEVRPFDAKQIELLASFADQAVIAIENARLFEAEQARTKELAASLDELRAAQDRLVQTEKLASLGQLTAGIAHEIKNPLNFVNNFSALSAELTDELNDVLKPAALSEKIRGEVDELTKTLKDNLEKVVQHGKRADSIVKNMLLHSREGTGEQRAADINSLLEESLNLAYHGARAEKPGFNITLQRDFDADAGAIELFPQEITRAFLNLISNGFYAATRRKAENGDEGLEPILRASTKNLGSTVEIRIRDNGTGIPAEVKEKMFNPFFTTKPAGEGTGLGLSMSHDIIVKQHGGTIDVATEPGQFTELTIVLPRTANSSNKIKSPA
jgi:GAF domain-containing protein